MRYFKLTIYLQVMVTLIAPIVHGVAKFPWVILRDSSHLLSNGMVGAMAFFVTWVVAIMVFDREKSKMDSFVCYVNALVSAALCGYDLFVLLLVFLVPLCITLKYHVGNFRVYTEED